MYRAFGLGILEPIKIKILVNIFKQTDLLKQTNALEYVANLEYIYCWKEFWILNEGNLPSGDTFQPRSLFSDVL